MRSLIIIGMTIFALGLLGLSFSVGCYLIGYLRGNHPKSTKGDFWGSVVFGVFFLGLLVPVLGALWNAYYKPNFFTDSYFGVVLDKFDKELVTPLADGGRQLDRRHGSDGRCVIEFASKKPSELFDHYEAHCFPHGLRPFQISAYKDFDLELDAKVHFEVVAEVLKQKYGKPKSQTETGIRYDFNGKTIELVLEADVLVKTEARVFDGLIYGDSFKRVSQVRYSVFRDELIKKLSENVKENTRWNNERMGRDL